MTGAAIWRRLPWRRKPLRIVIDARMADGVSGGVQQWIIGLAHALSNLPDGREEYLFAVNKGQADWLVPYLSGRCRLLPPPPPAGRPRPATRRRTKQLPRPLKRLRRLVRKLGGSPDRRPAPPRHAPWLSSMDEVVTLAGADVMHFPRQSAFATGVSSIYQPWDLQHVHLPEFFSEQARDAREVTYRESCERASLIVVATRNVKDDICAHFGISPEKVAVVNPPPVTAAYAPPGPDDERRFADRFELPERFAYYPAQTWGHKNHDLLLEALASLRSRGIEVPLICSGHANERDAAVLEHATALGIGDQVRFLGFLTPTEIQVVYRRATMLVFPSLYEGWGLPILEAFASGLPVACSSATSLPALVGEAAIVFEPTDPTAIAAAIERLWLDEELARELVARGRARVAEFDWNRTARLMRAQYRRVGGGFLGLADRGLLADEPLV